MARVLISAFSCFPGEGSEPGVGWKTVVAAAADHEVWVITDCARKEALLSHSAVKALPQVHWEFLRVPMLSRWAHGPWSHGVVWWVYYLVWQMVQGRVAKRLHGEVGFDLCHHATYVKYNTPSALPLLGIPFLWGPVGGAERAPMAFYRPHGWRTRIGEAARGVLQSLARIDPWLRWTALRATRAIAVTQETETEMLALGVHRCDVIPAVSLDESELDAIRAAAGTRMNRGDGDSLTVLFVGRLIPWKGVDLAIRAMAEAGVENMRLRVIGEGKERARLEALAAELGLASRVEFLGAMPREAVLRAYDQADGFLYPSLHDSGGQVVLEAMAAGLPVLTLRSGGPHVFVDDSCGWKVSVNQPTQVVRDLAACLREFSGSRELRHARGISARIRAMQHFHAEDGSVQIRRIYSEILAEAGDGESSVASRS